MIDSATLDPALIAQIDPKLLGGRNVSAYALLRGRQAVRTLGAEASVRALSASRGPCPALLSGTVWTGGNTNTFKGTPQRRGLGSVCRAPISGWAWWMQQYAQNAVVPKGDGVCWSFGESRYRGSGDNEALSIEWLSLDCDNGSPIEPFRDLLDRLNIAGIIQQRGGKFHVHLPLVTPIWMPPEEHWPAQGPTFKRWFREAHGFVMGALSELAQLRCFGMPNEWGFDIGWANRLLPLCYLYCRRSTDEPVPETLVREGVAVDYFALLGALGFAPTVDSRPPVRRQKPAREYALSSRGVRGERSRETDPGAVLAADPLVKALDVAGLLDGQVDDEKFACICPFEHEHGSGRGSWSSTVVFTDGGFHCSHTSCSATTGSVVEWLRGSRPDAAKVLDDAHDEAVRLPPYFRTPAPLPLQDGVNRLRNMIDGHNGGWLAHITSRERIGVLLDAECAERYPKVSGKRISRAFKRSERRFRRARREELEQQFGVVAPPTRVLGIRSTPGVGKTELTLQSIGRAFQAFHSNPGGAKLCVLYVAPTNALADEAEERFRRLAPSVPTMRFRGRHAEVPSPGSGHDGEPERMCLKPDEARRAGALGLNILKSLCGLPHSPAEATCEHYYRCGYMRQRRRLEQFRTGVIFATHSRLFRYPDSLPEPDLIVVDEDPVMESVGEVSIPWTCLAMNPHGAVVEAIEASASTVGSGLSLGVLRERLSSPFREAWHLLSEAAALEPSPTEPRPFDSDPVRLGRIEALARNPSPHRVEMLERLAEELRQFPQREHSRIVRKEVGRDGSLTLVLRRRDDIDLKLRSTPTLILDATANAMLLGALWPEVQVTAIEVYRHATIVQVPDRTASKSYFLRGEQGPTRVQSLRDAVSRMAHPHQRAVVVSTKQLEPYLQGIPGVDTAHFRALRGVNTFEEHDCMIVVGREQPRPEHVLAKAKALFWDDDREFVEEQGWEHRGYQMRHGQYGAKVSAFGDSRVQAVLEQIREAELVQVVDRVRATRRGERPPVVYLMTNIATELPIDGLVWWDDLVIPAIEEALWRWGGVLPLTEEFVRHYEPHLHGTAALRRAREGVGTGTTECDAVMLTVSPPGWPESHIRTRWFRAPCARRVKFRKQGGRGPWSVALVYDYLDEQTVRCRLESVMGHAIEWGPTGRRFEVWEEPGTYVDCRDPWLFVGWTSGDPNALLSTEDPPMSPLEALDWLVEELGGPAVTGDRVGLSRFAVGRIRKGERTLKTEEAARVVAAAEALGATVRRAGAPAARAAE